ncbi:MAG: hypothetical protein WA118_08215 [Carboxydocellales bacterium]
MKIKGEVYLDGRPTLIGGVINFFRTDVAYRPDSDVREGTKVQIYHQGRIIFTGTMRVDNVARGKYFEYGWPDI